MKYTCENCKSRNTWDCEDSTSICEDFDLDENTLTLGEQFDNLVMEHLSTSSQSFILNPIASLELTKAMIGRGVDYKVAEQIIRDFNKRMQRFKK